MTALPRVIAAIVLAVGLSGCLPDYTPQELAKIQAERDYDYNYQRCIDRVTGAFSSASVDVMKVCAAAAKQGRSIP